MDRVSTVLRSSMVFTWSFSFVLILLALLVHNSALAQFLPRYDDARLTRMGYSNTDNEEGVSIYQYRRDGVLGSGTWQLKDRSRYSANYYVYDDDGRLVEKYREFSDGLVSSQYFEHDEAGRVSRESFKRSDGITGYVDFAWGKHGQLLTADCRKFRGWFDGLIRYEYEAGRLSAATITRDGKPFGDISYIYDLDGRLVSETWDFGGKWSQTFSYQYEPVPERVFSASSPLLMMNHAYRVVGESYDFNSQGGGPSFYSYTATGRLEKKVFERSDGLKTETAYVFDEMGNLLSSHRSYHDGRTAEFSYSYDDALRLSGKTFRKSTGEEGFEAYSYDRLGRLVGASYRNMDFWLNGELTFAHDSWGHVESGQFSGQDDYDAELEFDTDEHGNILRMHWKFSNGMTQTYSFDYE